MKTCERCGNSFTCGAQKGGGSCWCMALPAVKNIPDTLTDCLCPECLRTFADQTEFHDKLEPSEKLELHRDYELNEQGYMVFTKDYLWRRGYCCQSGCTNCPYGFKKNTAP